MDRYEYNIILEKLNKLVEEEDYTAALGLVEEVDWKRVRNTRTLIMVSEIYEKNHRLEDAKDILLLAYERTTVGRSILYRLVEVAIALGNLDEALEYYMEYSLLYPNEPAKYILKYKVWRARESSLEDQIQALEAFKEQEYNEKWIYELAKLYDESGQQEKALAMCDEVILWFADGEYVQKSMELKRQYTSLTPEEEMKYRQVLVKEQLSGDNFLDEACDPEEVEPIEGRKLTRDEKQVEPSLAEADEVKDVEETDSDLSEKKVDIPLEGSDLSKEVDTSLEDNDIAKVEDTQGEEKFDFESLEDKIIQESLEHKAEKSIVDILNEHAQSQDVLKASSIELQLEDGVLETIQETKEKQEQLEEATRKNREELSKAMSLENIEAIVEESEAQKIEERIASSQPKAYEEAPLEQIQQEVSEGLDELADLIKIKEIEPESMPSQDEVITHTDAIGLDDYIPGQLSFDKLLAEMNQKESEAKVLREAENSLGESVSALFEEEVIEDAPQPAKEVEVEEEESSSAINIEENILDIGIGLEDFLHSISEYDEPTEADELVEVKEAVVEGELPQEEVVETENEVKDSQEEQEEVNDVLEAQEEVRDSLQAQPVVEDIPEIADSFEEQEGANDVFVSSEEVEDVLKNSEEIEEAPEVGSDTLVEEAKEEEDLEKVEKLPTADDLEAALLSALGPEFEELQTEENPVDDTQVEIALEDIKLDEDLVRKEDEVKIEETDLGLDAFLDNLMKEEAQVLKEEVELDLDDVFNSTENSPVESLPIGGEIKEQDLDEDLEEIAKDLTLDLSELLKDEDVEPKKEVTEEEVDLSELLSGEIEQILAEEVEPEVAKKGIDVYNPLEVEDKKEVVVEEDLPKIEKDVLTIEETIPLTEEQTRMLSYFAPIPGISDQVSQVLAEVRRKGYDAKTSKEGNLIVMGRQGSGKTTLATNVLKAIEKEKGKDTFKIANISAKDLNTMNVAEVIEKIGGGGLIIEEASLLDDKTIQELSLAMNMRTDGLTIILEDDKRNMKAILGEHSDFASKFTSQIVIPVFTNDELVEFAKSYADENGYGIDEMGILALYNRIGLNQSEDKPVAVADVKDMVDYAIESAESKAFGLFCGLFQKRDKEDKKGILLEKHFEK